MEPPAKRPRLDEPPFDARNHEQRWFDDHEAQPHAMIPRIPGLPPPELNPFFKPPKSSNPSEPPQGDQDDVEDYELAQKRARASRRFQRTMADIFAKYERDFTDVGDEVDLETGEVIVDNGHLENLRYEGDVGVDEGSSEGEDEGVRLEDLVDEDEEEGVRLGDLADDDDEEDEEDAIRLEDIPEEDERSAGPTIQEGREEEEDEEEGEEEYHGQVMAQGPFPQHPMAMMPYGHPYFAGPQMAQYPNMNQVFMGFKNGAPVFGAMPPHMTPWGFFGNMDMDGSAWEMPRPETAPRAQKRKVKPKLKASRHGPPAASYNGGTSIWAPTRGYDGWSGQRVSKTKAANRRKGPISNSRLLPDASFPTMSRTQRAARERAARRDSKYIFKGMKVDALNDDGGTTAVETSEDMPDDRRRSGRARKPVAFLGKISWMEAAQEEMRTRALQQTPHDAVPDNEERGLMTPPESGRDATDIEPQTAPKSSRAETIPDSQETLSSTKSPAKSRYVHYMLGAPNTSLSDDENPVLFAKPKPAVAANSSKKRSIPKSTAMVRFSPPQQVLVGRGRTEIPDSQTDSAATSSYASHSSPKNTKPWSMYSRTSMQDASTYFIDDLEGNAMEWNGGPSRPASRIQQKGGYKKPAARRAELHAFDTVFYDDREVPIKKKKPWSAAKRASFEAFKARKLATGPKKKRGPYRMKVARREPPPRKKTVPFYDPDCNVGAEPASRGRGRPRKMNYQDVAVQTEPDESDEVEIALHTSTGSRFVDDASTTDQTSNVGETSHVDRTAHVHETSPVNETSQDFLVESEAAPTASRDNTQPAATVNPEPEEMDLGVGTDFKDTRAYPDIGNEQSIPTDLEPEETDMGFTTAFEDAVTHADVGDENPNLVDPEPEEPVIGSITNFEDAVTPPDVVAEEEVHVDPELGYMDIPVHESPADKAADAEAGDRSLGPPTPDQHDTGDLVETDIHEDVDDASLFFTADGELVVPLAPDQGEADELPTLDQDEISQEEVEEAIALQLSEHGLVEELPLSHKSHEESEDRPEQDVVEGSPPSPILAPLEPEVDAVDEFMTFDDAEGSPARVDSGSTPTAPSQSKGLAIRTPTPSKATSGQFTTSQFTTSQFTTSQFRLRSEEPELQEEPTTKDAKDTASISSEDSEDLEPRPVTIRTPKNREKTPVVRVTPSPAKQPVLSKTPTAASSSTTKSGPSRRLAVFRSKRPSRKSILSMLARDDRRDDFVDTNEDDDLVTTNMSPATLPRLFAGSSGPSSVRKQPWKTSVRASEVRRASSTFGERERDRDGGSPDVVLTSATTTKICGVDGYTCGQDLCFNCL